VVVSQAFIQQDHAALEREVASCSFPYPRSEGREEPTMDHMSTIVVKHKHREQSPF
jgi:hypothetical protein